KGGVSFRADIEAPRPDVASVSGRLVFPDLQFDFDGLTLAQQEMSEIELANGDINIRKFVLDGTVGHVDVTGRAGLLEPRPVDLVARASIDAATATKFAKQARVGGQTTLEIAATGTMGQPLVKGFVELVDGRIAVVQPQIAAQDLQARIDFTPEHITLS